MVLNNKLMQQLLGIVSVIIVVMTLLLLILAIFPFNIITVHHPLEIANKNKTVMAGSNIYFYMDYDKYYNETETISIQLLTASGVIAHVLTVIENLPLGKNKLLLDAMMPLDIKDKEAKIKIIIRYSLHSFRNKDLVYESEEFKIVPPGVLNE